jgi:diguanylate cyclase (GGDEF)-like protein
MVLVIFFCSSGYDLEVLGEAMRRRFQGVQVVGCTTAGEIGPDGFSEHSISGVSFAAPAFRAASGSLEHLAEFTVAGGHQRVQELLQQLERQTPGTGWNAFGLLLIDGLSMREELVAHALQGALGRIPMIGGSAGHGGTCHTTRVYSDGQFRADSAALVLVSTRLPFQVFKTQHHLATGERLVVTRADPARRLVQEINGLPAAQEYARLVGSTAPDLSPDRFAAWPVVVLIDGTSFVRSIQQANPDGSLTFFCAIEEGLVLRLAHGGDLLANLEQTFARVRAAIGQPQLLLACDCILRRVELDQGHLREDAERLFMEHAAVGFNTYGEQFRGVHINQTLVGIAIGTGPRAPGRPARERPREPIPEPLNAPRAPAAASAEIARLNKVVAALMDRAERSASVQTSGYSLLQTAILLEEQVRLHTAGLEAALAENERITRTLKESEAKFQEDSTRDALTGLYNRRFLQDSLERELAAARRHGGPISLIMVDLDHFKAINDRYGHLGGDQVLRAIGDILHRQVRGSDIFSRFGGEEFLLVLPGMPLETAAGRAALLRQELAATPIAFGAEQIPVTASFGVAAFPGHGDSAQSLVAAADLALYAAKRAGRNRVHLAPD